MFKNEENTLLNIIDILKHKKNLHLEVLYFT